MKITYNAPVVLSFALLCVAVLAIDGIFFPSSRFLTSHFFSVGGTFQFTNPLNYISIFGHAVGHSGWSHLIGNFTFILLLGPLLEEKYGSKPLLLMMFLTALVTGILNVVFFSTGLLGASGIVFMFIILSSITNMRRGQIPLTFILVMALYVGQELLKLFEENNISEFAHIVGGICGAVFGLKWVRQAEA